MSDGLDFTVGTPDGVPMRLTASMLASFDSVTVAQELSSGVYPLVQSFWDFRSTAVHHDEIPVARAELVNLIKALVKKQADQKVIDELDDLLVFLKGIESLGLGVFVSGP